MGDCTGFLGSGNPAPEGGLWLGIGLSNRFDGLWGFDYYTMPNHEITMPDRNLSLLPASTSNSVTFISTLSVLPTDDFSMSVNIRWYWGDKYDNQYRHFNAVPYLVAGLGLDMVIDQDPRPPNTNFYSASYDELFSGNLGIGMDFPLWDRQQWFLHAEGMDHFIFWQGVTQIYSARLGVKVMLDGEHIDPFRGAF
jgi:hypothetical protein